MPLRRALSLACGLALLGSPVLAQADVGDCVVNAECKNPTPVCGVGRVCTGCTWEADCAGRPATPACLAQTGSCVECTAYNGTACRGTTPVCDAPNSKCVGCNSSDECAGGKTCVNQKCMGSGTDAGPVTPPDAGFDAGGTSPTDVTVEGGGCSASGGSLASMWPILGLALAGLTRRRNRR